MHCRHWIAFTALIALAAPASAATTAEQEALFQKTLANPGDHETTFTYVRVSEELGDYEAAIGALERLLFFDPSLTRVKYELGALYFRVHSYQMAAQYFRDALASPGLDAETRARIEAYLPETEKQLSPARTWLFFQTGIRYQSNASFTPLGGEIMSGGVLQPIDPDVPQGADWNAFALGQFANDFDFGNQNGDKLETRITGYQSLQFQQPGLNVGLLSGSIGPRFALAADAWPGLTAKPYIVGSATWLAGNPYQSNAGAGITLSAPLGSKVTVWPWFEWQRAFYDDSNADNTLGTSDWWNPGVGADVKFSDMLSMTGKFSYRRAIAANPWQSYNSFSEEIGFALRFDPPFSHIGQKWTLTPFLRLTQAAFDAPNLAIDPNTAREDRRWQIGAGLDAPVNTHFGFSGIVSYERSDSNIPNYSYDNWSVLFGPTARF